MKNYKNNSKSWLMTICAVGMLTVLLSACVKDNNNTPVPPAALVSFYQASPDQQPLDLVLNSNKVNYPPLNYGDYLDYFRAYTGSRIINIYNHFTAGKIVADTVQLLPNVAYSLYLANTASAPQLVLLTDSISQPTSGKAAIRFVNMSPDAGTVDLAVTGGSVFLGNKAFKGHTAFVETAAGTVNYEVRQKGTNTVLATLPNINVTAGFVYTIVFHGLKTTAVQAQKLKADIITNAVYN